MTLAASLILSATAWKYGTDVASILSHRRPKSLVAARREAAKRLRAECDMSYPEIGEALNKDHSTAQNLVKGRKRAVAVTP